MVSLVDVQMLPHFHFSLSTFHFNSFSHSSHIHTHYVLREAYFLTLFEKSLARMYMYHHSFTRGSSIMFHYFTFHFQKKSLSALFSRFIRYSCRWHQLGCGVYVGFLVVEKYIRSKGFEHLTFTNPA